MLQLESQSLIQPMPQSTKTAVMVIGGAEDKVHGREILHTFFERAGGMDACIAILPCASREPAILGTRYHTIFSEMGAPVVKVLDIRERNQCEDPGWREYLESCTGVFMTGGDQVRLCALLGNTDLIDSVRQKAQKGQITLAGTSAGAAVMGHHMIAGGGSGEHPNRSLVDMSIGLGIIPEVIVDQHFHNRNRMARLMSAIAGHPDKLGIGIDEDTCAVFERDGLLQVIGKGTITIIDPQSMSYTNQPLTEATLPISLHDLRVHILGSGDRYNLYKRETIPPDTLRI
jgi:cyanophycinase